MIRALRPLALTAALAAPLWGCVAEDPEGLAPAPLASTTVKMDFFAKPLPEIPLPNDVATRFDGASATGRRINASMVAPTRFESHVRKLIDQLDGWGIYQPITIPFTGPLDIASITRAHWDKNYALENDVVYLINVDPGSPEFGRFHRLDVGNGNYPVVLESKDKYWKNDPRDWTLSLLFEEADEDLDGDGAIDPGEDTDADGVLDRPNYLPAKLTRTGKLPADRDQLALRADALMYFYERQTDTLIVRPMMPLRERTTYAVVVTRRLRDADGQPVGSPFPYINHASQTRDLAPLPELLPRGTTIDDVAFAFTFTTQSVKSHMVAVREGLYGKGIQAHLGQNYPAEVKRLFKLKDSSVFKNMKNPHVLYSEQMAAVYEEIAKQLLNQDEDSAYYKIAMKAQKYVDFHVVGAFESPQLFPRYKTVDGEKVWLPLNDQSWPPDLDRVPAKARGETVYFWLVVPRKEISARGKGEPAPVVVLSHGYTSNRFEALMFGAYLARHGLATLAIDCPSHGLALSKSEQLLAKGLGAVYGLGPFVEAALTDRALDMNNDGKKDSGGDYWTAYMFHTRDQVRQSALDYMQLIRVFRGFDGTRTWKHDPLGTGKPGVAGDFDGDGKVDVGGSAQFHMTGGSLGGIMSFLVGGIEPALTTIVPVAGAGALGDVALRSRQGGVPEPVILRVMGPLYVGTLDSKSGSMKLETIIPDLNDKKELPLATVEGVSPGDTMVVDNLVNGERGCGVVNADGKVRAGVASDLGDRSRIAFYRGYVVAGEDCALKQGVKPYLTVDKLAGEVSFQGQTFAAGSALRAFAEGLGLRRASPELRRFISLAQVVLDSGDPASFARHYQREPLVYPALGEQTGTHVLAVTTIGDMNVPASTGIIAARAAGLIDFMRDDPRYGKSPNQVLIDNFVAEAAHNIKRFTDSSGNGVHMDVDDFSGGTDRFGADVPRLSPPLRLGFGRRDRLGGASAAIFPISSPTGTHGFDFPGQMLDKARKQCRKACKKSGGNDPCGCNTLESFDIGNLMLNLMGRYFTSGGKDLRIQPCYAYDSCPDNAPPPKARDKDKLP